MGISLSAQTAYFLWSLVLGLALGALYDIVRAARMLFRAGRIHTTVSDIVFFIVCGVVTALFALPFNKGDVRGFILFGEAVGFSAYRLTLGCVMGKVYAFFAKKVRSFVQFLRKKLQLFFDFLLKATSFLLYNVGVVIDKSRQRAAKSKQKHRAAKARSRAQRLSKVYQYEQKRVKKTAYHGSQAPRRSGRGSERR